MVLWHCAGRPWYTQKAGYGAPYKLAGVVGDVFGQTYTSVLYKDPLMPKMVGVVWGDFKSIGNVETYVAACAHCTVSRVPGVVHSRCAGGM